MNIKKAIRWEFWPYWLFYTPVYFYYLYLALKLKSLGFIAAANPVMDFGGFVEYSKYDILRLLPEKNIPKTVYIEEAFSVEEILKRMSEKGISFPIILKPNRGERGWGVEKLNSPEQVSSYLSRLNRDLILQEYVTELNEYGFLYCRFPGEPRGTLTSLVIKELLTVTGDGHSTVLELCRQNERTQYHWETLQNTYSPEFFSSVPEAGYRVPLLESGNHCRGATFYDGNSLITEKHIEVLDRIATGIEGFYIGRFDIRTKSLKAIEEGDFKIIELNGANSEPAHIYDPDNSLSRAYSDLFAHWRRMYRVCQENMQQGFVPPRGREVFRAIVDHNKRKR